MSIAINLEKELYKGFVPRPSNTSATDTENKLQEDYSLELLMGKEVFELLSKPRFQSDWDTLYESCSWATIFQSRGFVTGWYQVYKEVHLPIIIKATRGGRLSGLLTMTLLDGVIKTNAKRISGAGHFDAVYQTWLAIPADKESFVQQALTVLMNRFPGVPVTFRYLPPETPLDWMKSNKKWRNRSILQPYSRPLINLKDEEVTKTSSRNHFKSKFNRLKKSGEVKFERVHDVESFAKSLDDVAALYDFRQGAMFNKNHFRNDPLKKDFLLEMLRSQLLHVSVLKVNGSVLAAIASLAGKHSVHLSGFICHSPFGSKFNSPGYLQFVLLSKMLAEEQYQYFDLTPGYDSYKEQFATLHDEVYEWTLSNKPVFRIKKRIRKWAHSRMVRAGIRPMSAELNVKKFFYRLRNRSISSQYKKWVTLLTKKNAPQLYSIQPANLSTPALPIVVQKNNLDDLLQFNTDKKAGLTRWDFTSDALFRLSKGEYCFTWVEDDRLLGCAWLNRPDTFAAQNDAAANETILLQNIYCHPAAKNRIQPFLETVASMAVDRKVTTSIQFSAEEKQVCKALEAAGFTK